MKLKKFDKYDRIFYFLRDVTLAPFMGISFLINIKGVFIAQNVWVCAMIMVVCILAAALFLLAIGDLLFLAILHIYFEEEKANGNTNND